MSSTHSEAGTGSGHDLMSPSQRSDQEVLQRVQEDAADKATTISLLKVLTRRKSHSAEDLHADLNALPPPASVGAAAVRSAPPVVAEVIASPPVAHAGAHAIPVETTAAPPLLGIAVPPAAAAVGSGAAALHAPKPAGPALSTPPTSAKHGDRPPSGGPAAGAVASAAQAPVAAVSGGDIVVEEVDVRSSAAFQRVAITGPAVLTSEQKQACKLLRRALELREKHLFRKPAYYWGCYSPDQFPFSPKGRHTAAGAGGMARRESAGSLASAGGSGQAGAGAASGASPHMSVSVAHSSSAGAAMAAAGVTPGHSPKVPGAGHGGAAPSSSLPSPSHAASAGAGAGASGGKAAAAPRPPAVTGARRSSLSGQEGANSSHPHPHHPSSGGGAKAGAGAAAAGQLLTPTLTGVVASAEAAGSLPPAMLQGSALVTLETGKDYGNLFHRRRLEPPFKPFAAPGADALPHLHHRFKDGVMEVVMVHAPPRPPAARVPLMPSRSTIEGAFASPKEDVNPGNSHPAPADGDPTAATAVPSREFVEGAFLEEGEDEEGGVAVTSANLFPVPSFSEYHSDYFELCRIVHSPFVKSFAYRRLELLEARFQLHKQLNSDRELMESKAVPHRDFYNVRKVRRRQRTSRPLPLPLRPAATAVGCSRPLRPATRSCPALHFPSPLPSPAGGHPRAPQRVHEPEAPAQLHQDEAQDLPRRGGDRARWQGPHPEAGVRVPVPHGLRPLRGHAGCARTRHLPPVRSRLLARAHLRVRAGGGVGMTHTRLRTGTSSVPGWGNPSCWRWSLVACAAALPLPLYCALTPSQL